MEVTFARAKVASIQVDIVWVWPATATAAVVLMLEAPIAMASLPTALAVIVPRA